MKTFLYFVVIYYVLSKILITPLLFKILLKDWDKFSKKSDKALYNRTMFFIPIMQFIKYTTFSFRDYRFIIIDVIQVKFYIKYHTRFSYNRKLNCYLLSSASFNEGLLNYVQFLSQKLVLNQLLEIHEEDYAFVSFINAILKGDQNLQKYVVTRYYEDIVNNNIYSEFTLASSNFKLIKEA